MISVCTAAQNPAAEEYFLPSVTRMTDVGEVIICYQSDEFVRPDENYNGVRIRRIAALQGGILFPKANIRLPLSGYYHALSLHESIDLAEGDYIMLSDNDIFHMYDTTKMYLEVMEAGADIVGVQHYAPEINCYAEFVTVINCMMKRESLPDKDFLKGELKLKNSLMLADQHLQWHTAPPPENDEGLFDGKWLLQGFIEKYAHDFPYKYQTFDVGCNLWIWVQQQKLNWLAFRPLNPWAPEYTTVQPNGTVTYKNDTGVFMYHKGMRGNHEDFSKLISEL